MKKEFTVEEAIQYCQENGANMLISDINWLESEAVFKLFSVQNDDDLFMYIEDSVEDEHHNFITPSDLQGRGEKTVWLDISKIIKVTDQNAQELIR